MTIPNVDPFVQVIVDFDADNVDMKVWPWRCLVLCLRFLVCHWKKPRDPPIHGQFSELLLKYNRITTATQAGMFEGGNIGHVACDLTIVGQDCKKTTNIFNPAKSVCGGRFRMARQVHIPIWIAAFSHKLS
jgi:hypothetical protein